MLGLFVVALVTGLLSLVLPSTADDPSTWSPAAVQERFTACGYDASAPALLGTIPSTLLPRLIPIVPDDDVAVLVVRDPGERRREDGRSVSVLVLPDQARATATFAEGVRLTAVGDRLRAAARGADLETPTPGTDGPDLDHGPPLLLGHGRSVWRRNVALVQLLTPPVTLLPAVADALEDRAAADGPVTSADYATALQTALTQLRPRRRADPTRLPSAVDRDLVACVETD